MAESTLAFINSDYSKAVGSFLGYGTDTSVWTVSQLAEINDSVRSGLRNFYNPVLPGNPPKGYLWSFLRPVRQLSTVVDQGDYDLPDDFGGIEGDITFQALEGFLTIVVGSENEIMKARQLVDRSGFPRIAAIRPKFLTSKQVDTLTLTGTSGTATLTINTSDFLATFTTDLTTSAANFVTTHAAGLTAIGITATAALGIITLTAISIDTAISTQTTNLTGDLDATVAETVDGTKGQRFELMLYPRPTEISVLDYRYNVLPERLSDANPNPYGGMQHSETILESCLAVAEERYDDTPNGLHKRKFVERLFASVDTDSKVNRPENIGYNRDSSDRRNFRGRSRINSVTVNGIFYQGGP